MRSGCANLPGGGLGDDPSRSPIWPFENMSNQWREEQNRCQREIERHQNADKSYLEKAWSSRTGPQRPKVVLDAGTVRKTSPSQLRAIELHLGGWRGGRHFREPFDLLAETATNSTRLGTSETFRSAKIEIWLGN
jgi:site-specific DNA recombinase